MFFLPDSSSGDSGQRSIAPRPGQQWRIALLYLVALLGWLATSPVWAQAFSWPTAPAEDVGMDPARLALLQQQSTRGDFGKLRSLLILRHGKLVFEQYYNGFGQEDSLPLYSASKSWASALIGVAIERGDIGGTEQKLTELLPQYRHLLGSSSSKSELTLHDLLTMRAGLDWDEWSTWVSDPVNPVNQMTRAPDWWAYTLGRKQTASPDSVFRYNTGSSNLLGAVIWSATSRTAADYAREFLFEPMDIDSFRLEVNLNSWPAGPPGLTQFPPGHTPMGHGWWLRARDLAKLGQLYLDDGIWRGKRLLPKGWVETSWSAFSDHGSDPLVFKQPGDDYGYQWWGWKLNTSLGELAIHMAWGWDDQFLLVVPQLDLVVASQANNGNSQGKDVRNALIEHILPAVVEAQNFDPVSDSGLTGPWFDPSTQSQGIMFEVVPSTGVLVIFWVHFHPDSGEQQWLIGSGQMRGRRVQVELLRPEGGRFNSDQPADLPTWGQVTLEFSSCTEATMSYDSPLQKVSGTLNLQRLTPNVYCR